MRRLEAVLFLAHEPISSRKLSQYANLADGAEARTLIRRLNQFYDQAERAFRVEEVAGGFRLMTRPQFGAWVKRLAHVPAEVRLSPPALETLAVVAYRQPVLKATVEAIRGVHCGEVLRQLMERDLVRIVGRSEELGRPYLYAPTTRFLEVFGLRSLEELPRVEGLRPRSAAGAADNQQHSHREEHDVTVTYASAHPQQEIETVRNQALSQERFPSQRNGATGAIPAVAEDDEEFEEDGAVEDDDEEDLEEDDDLDEEFDEDLEEEDWEYEDEEEGEFEDDLEEDEWEEVEGEDDEELEEEDDEDWEDDDEEEDEDWEDE